MSCPSKPAQKRKKPNIECEKPAKKKMAWDSYNSVKDFGYEFNEEGRLVMIDDNEAGFNFYISDDHSYNQKNYEMLGEVITEYVYELLQSEEVGLEKLEIPLTKESFIFPNSKKQKSKDGAKGFIFVSKDFHSKDKLLVLVHGSGVVRAGQWARRLIINDCLDHGTQIPYIKRAIKDGYGVVVMNTNQNDAYVDVKGQKVWKQIKESESPEKHFSYVWKNIIWKTSASRIFVVAHSYGGYLVVDHFSSSPKCLPRVVAVAFTDSVHSFSRLYCKNETRNWFMKNSVNWVSSDSDLGTPMSHQDDEKHVTRVSAGTTKHEETSWKAMESIFKYFQIQESEFDNIKENSKMHGKKSSSKTGRRLACNFDMTMTGDSKKESTSHSVHKSEESFKGRFDEQDRTEKGITEVSSDQQNVAGEGSPDNSAEKEDVAGDGNHDDNPGQPKEQDRTEKGITEVSSDQQDVAGEGSPDNSADKEDVAGDGNHDDKRDEDKRDDNPGQPKITGDEDNLDDNSGEPKVTSDEDKRDDSSGEPKVTGDEDKRDDSSGEPKVTSDEDNRDDNSGQPKVTSDEDKRDDSSGEPKVTGDEDKRDDSSGEPKVTSDEDKRDDSSCEPKVTGDENNRDDSSCQPKVIGDDGNCDDSSREPKVTGDEDKRDDSSCQLKVTGDDGNCDDSSGQPKVTGDDGNCDDNSGQPKVTGDKDNHDNSSSQPNVTGDEGNCDNSSGKPKVAGDEDNHDNTVGQQRVTTDADKDKEDKSDKNEASNSQAITSSEYDQATRTDEINDKKQSKALN